MNILFVVPYLPSKIRVRPYNWIRHLAQRGHEITLLSILSGEEDLQILGELNKYCERVVTTNLSRWRSIYNCLAAIPTKEPLQAVYAWEPKLAETLYKLATQTNDRKAYDIVHIEHLRGARYGVDLITRSTAIPGRLPIVWDSVDSISLLFRQAVVQSKSILSKSLTRFDLKRTEWYEGWLVGQFDQVLVTAEEDRQSLLSLQSRWNKKTGVDVLPNGVDLDYFSPTENGIREDQTIILSGKMSYHANVAMVVNFIEMIMPRIWAKRPEVKVWIVGKNPPSRLVNYKRMKNVEVTGTVENMRDYLAKATLAATPIDYGVGIQNKVLEAMACETPVIASPQAVSSINVKNGKDIIVADDPEDFARKVIFLLDDPEYRESIGKAGRKFVEKNHDWRIAAAQLEEIYFRSLNQPVDS